MSESKDFLRTIVEEDLEAGKYSEVHTRFPPEPNGFPHIGHAKSICINFGIANDYNGQCNLRMDDTNPTTEDTKYVEALKDVKGIKGPLVFGLYAILIQMLSYTMWHISNPTPELIGTIFWGIGVGAVALRVKSVWPIIISHWLLNVIMDTALWLRFG